MKKILFIAMAILTTVSFSFAQEGKSKKNNWNYNSGWGGKRVEGTGPVVTEDRSVSGFTGVTSGISADVTVKQASSFKVTISGQKNILDLLKTDVVNGKLKITFEKGYSMNYREPIKVTVEAPSFDYLGMSGSGNVNADGTLSGSKLAIDISGSGNFNLTNVKYENVNFGISGSGDVRVGGSTDMVKFDVSGSGNIKAGDLKSQTASCHVSGSGDITCNAEKSLDAHISGSGDIKYSGSPSIKSRVTGSGDVKPVR
jgi:hypothetical protein